MDKTYSKAEIERALQRSDDYWSSIEDKLKNIIASQHEEILRLQKALKNEAEDIELCIDTFDLMRSVKCNCSAITDADSAYWHLYLKRH